MAWRAVIKVAERGKNASKYTHPSERSRSQHLIHTPESEEFKI